MITWQMKDFNLFSSCYSMYLVCVNLGINLIYRPFSSDSLCTSLPQGLYTYWDFLFACLAKNHMPGIILSILHMLIYLICTITLCLHIRKLKHRDVSQLAYDHTTS